jgi:hypothetical protein
MHLRKQTESSKKTESSATRMEFGRSEVEEVKERPTQKYQKQQGFIPAEVLSFIGFGTDFINCYYKYMLGKHSSFVDELINHNSHWHG